MPSDENPVFDSGTPETVQRPRTFAMQVSGDRDTLLWHACPFDILKRKKVTVVPYLLRDTKQNSFDLVKGACLAFADA